jgi:hypothetical protein
VRDARIWAAMAALVIAVWLGGAAVTKFSLEQMAYFAPIGVVAVAATVGIVLLWVKVVLDSLRRRRNEG